MGNVTQSDIAAKTGFSQTAVSMVLNRRKDVAIPHETRSNILRTAKKLGYTPRPLRIKNKKKTGNIGYLIPKFSASSFISNSYYHRFFEGISKEIKEMNLNLILLSSSEKNDLLLRIQRDKKFDGLIVETLEVDKEWAKEITRVIPIVFLNISLKENNLDSVMPDNRGGIKKAVSHLYQLGHRRIAFFGMKPFSLHTLERLCGYKEALEELGIPEEKKYLKLPERKRGGKEEVVEFTEAALKEWFTLSKPPTSVVTMSDTYGLSLLQSAVKSGIDIPRQLSVVGFDNIEACQYSHPPLTSINQHMEEMGESACRLLLERIKTPDKPARKIIVDVDLIERNSTCAM